MPPEPRRCPICKLPRPSVLAERDYGDKITYDCKRCGEYSISGTAESVAENNNRTAGLSAWLRERNLLNSEIPLLTTDFVKDVLDALPEYSPLEKQRKLLTAVKLLTIYPGHEVILIPELSCSLAWAENEEEFIYYVRSLVDRGLLAIKNPEKRTLNDPLFPMVITSAGWEYLEADQSNAASGNQVFIAMSFDLAMLPTYKNAIEPAIEGLGYRPHRVDQSPHLERIDAKIISEIRQSRFLVADVTQQKAGVYYEAGYAHGLGIPVIWCVRKDELKRVHFDTRQYNHLLWETEEELYNQLQEFISATIGRFAT